jgi:hypothetical protein
MLLRLVLRASLFAAGILAVAVTARAVDEPSAPRLLWPLEERTCVTGSFGEYRSNHFHAGIDISTGGRIGLPVRAPAAGRVVRLRTSPYGYGKVIYIDIDDPARGSDARGRQVVCAHLSDFAPRWRALVEAEQERLGRYTVDFAVPDSPRVEAGEIVAYTGDTGGGPPHLHFEVREGDAAPIDPLAHGWTDRDREPPLVSKVRLVPLGLDGRVDGGLEPQVIDVARSSKDGVYRPKSATPPIEGRVGVQVMAWDPGAGACDARRGIKAASLRLDDETLFNWEVDRTVYDVDFNLIHERYDYQSRIGNDRFVRLYDRISEKGAVSFDGDDSLEIEVRDSAGNASRVSVVLHGVRDNGELDRLESAVDNGAPGMWILPPTGRPASEERGTLRVESSIVPSGVILGIEGPSHGTLFVQSGTRSREGFHANRSDSITADRVAGSWLWYAAPASLFGGSWFEGWGASSDAERVLRVVWRSGASAQTDSILLELSGLASFDAGDGGSFATSSIFDVAAKWEWPKDALLGDAFVVTSSAATAPDLAPGLTLHGRPFRAEPMDLPLSKQMTLTAIAPIGAGSDPRHLGIFRVWSDGEIEPLSSGDELTAKTWLLGTFALIEDQSPPRITRMSPASGSTTTSTRPKFTIDVVDEGKGIDDEATRFVLDGQRLIAEYDPEANVITAKPKAALARGVHTLEVTIRDEAGHETSRTSEFTVGAARSRSKKGR